MSHCFITGLLVIRYYGIAVCERLYLIASIIRRRRQTTLGKISVITSITNITRNAEARRSTILFPLKSLGITVPFWDELNICHRIYLIWRYMRKLKPTRLGFYLQSNSTEFILIRSILDIPAPNISIYNIFVLSSLGRALGQQHTHVPQKPQRKILEEELAFCVKQRRIDI